MARVISIFFSPPDDVAANRKRELEELFGFSFDPESGDGLIRYAARCLGLELVWFNNHGLVNDAGISFEDYEYELDITIMSIQMDASVTEAHQYSASRYIFHLFADVLRWKSCLVDNLQQLLAIFPPAISEVLG